MASNFNSENDIFGFSNPSYNLVSSDGNCNIDLDDSYEDLYEGIDVTCRINPVPGIRSRKKYANLDPTSMGVNVHSERIPMLTTNTENYLNQAKCIPLSKSEDSFILADNGNSVLDSNDNKQMGKKSNILDHYINLDSSTQYEYSPLPGQVICSDIPVILNERLPGPSSLDKHELRNQIDCNLPTGWEKHEDENGPYYWHINSGTIQRDPPISTVNKATSRISKDINIISSNTIFLNSHSSSTDNNGKNIGCILNSYSLNDKNKRKSCPEGSCVGGDKRPIRFAVRSLGWLEIAEEDLTPERSSKAVNKCIVDLSIGKKDILDVVGRWGDGKDLFMDLDEYSLRLINIQDSTILNTQPIHTIRVWGVGRDNGRDFAYVARDRITKNHMCHVFRCDIPARIIANTLRDICKKIMIERSLQRSLSKQDDLTSEPLVDSTNKPDTAPIRPSDLPVAQRLFPQLESQSSFENQLFPTPMEEPKKVLKAYYLGSTNVNKATGVEILNDAIEHLSASVEKSEYKYVSVAIAPSTITVMEQRDGGAQLAECRVRFLSFLGIGKNIKHCGFIVHTALDDFVAHVFYCEPSSGALCKTIEAACKLRYQKCLDAHRQNSDDQNLDTHHKGLKSTLKSVFGSFFATRMQKSAET